MGLLSQLLLAPHDQRLLLALHDEHQQLVGAGDLLAGPHLMQRVLLAQALPRPQKSRDSLQLRGVPLLDRHLGQS